MQKLPAPKRQADDDVVPPELRNQGHLVWRVPGLFTAWCRREGIAEPPGETWAVRYQAARDLWAKANGHTTPTGYVDHVKLIDELRIPWSGSLTRAMARAEAASADPDKFRRDARLNPYGPMVDKFPRTDPRL